MRPSRGFLLPLLLCCLSLSCRSAAPPARPSVPGAQNSALFLAEEIKLMQRQGLPTTPAALQAPLPPADRNAAPLYQQLDALLKAKPAVGDDKIATDGVGRRPLTAEQATKLRLAFQNRADIGRLIHQAVARPECVFTRDWTQGVYLPEYARMRLAARWLSAESALQLYDNEPIEAVKTEALGFRLADHATKVPTLDAHLVSIAIDAITLAGMERILYAAGDRPGVAAAVQHAIETERHDHSLAHALHGEIVFPLVEMEKDRNSGPKAYEKLLHMIVDADALPAPALSPEDRQNWNAFINRSEIAMIHSLHVMIAAADKPYPEASPAFQNVHSNLQAHQQDAAYTPELTVFPVYEQALKKSGQISAKATTVRAGAALCAWKAQHGAFPEKLEKAMPKVPRDPFDGKLLRYRKEGAGFVVYSVGPTARFDGGSPAVKPDAMESVFRYPLPAEVK